VRIKILSSDETEPTISLPGPGPEWIFNLYSGSIRITAYGPDGLSDVIEELVVGGMEVGVAVGITVGMGWDDEQAVKTARSRMAVKKRILMCSP